MSFIPITPDNIERYELLANPRVYFASSSSGITGSLRLFADGSSTLKDVHSSVGLYSQATSASNDSDIESSRSMTKNAFQNGTNYFSALSYMNAVHDITSSTKFDKTQEVIRFVPPVTLNDDFMRKKIVKNNLFPFYRHMYPTMQWNYTNYHTINFVTGGNLPTDSVLIYPAGTGTVQLEDQNSLAPSSSFTFDFYINPRYTVPNIGDEFNPGTVFHMSSCYAISLVTGSSIGIDGKPDGFRLLLQLSQSAEIPPSKCAISQNTVTAPDQSADKGFLFISKDNSLKKNTWHHVGIRWGGTQIENGTGSFVIDGVEQGRFVISSASCMQSVFPGNSSINDPDALFIGNFFEGGNKRWPISGFFNSTVAEKEGVTPFGSPASSNDPQDALFRHPLNAEVHELKIFQTYRTNDQLLTSSLTSYPFVTGSVSLTGSQDILFYVPPFFVKESLSRDILQTPFQSVSNSVSDDPFNVALSFGVGGHEINLQNFVKDFVRGKYPRLYKLSSQEVVTTTPTAQTANYFLYESGSVRKRNITILPCDNGKFYPNFNMLLSDGLTESSSGNALDRFVNDFGSTDLSIIKLNDLVSTSSLFKNITDDYTQNRDSILGNLVTPVSFTGSIEPGVTPGGILTILQRTGDNSSNEVVFFDISNMFYGDRIKANSVVLTDLSVTGSDGRVQITLKDDGYGNLYRADALTPPAKWSSVGNVIYEEGIIVVKSPNVPMFGSDSWEISFQGERKIHVLEMNIPAPKSYINSSTNPTYQDMTPSDYPNENAKSFVYLTGLQIHDENLNVIGRANLAQPVIKRDEDRIVFKLRLDY
jgi:hypothetical protein